MSLDVYDNLKEFFEEECPDSYLRFRSREKINRFEESFKISWPNSGDDLFSKDVTFEDWLTRYIEAFRDTEGLGDVRYSDILFRLLREGDMVRLEHELDLERYLDSLWRTMPVLSWGVI